MYVEEFWLVETLCFDVFETVVILCNFPFCCYLPGAHVQGPALV